MNKQNFNDIVLDFTSSKKSYEDWKKDFEKSLGKKPEEMIFETM